MSRVGFGIIGCGTIAPIHAEAVSGVRGARLLAVADVVEKNAKALAKRYAADAYTDYRAMLERDDVHAVNLCVPTGMRAEIAEACANAGKHILAEKPLEVSMKRIKRILAATDRAGVKLGCIFQNRFAEGSIRVHKAIQAGRFGRLVLGDAYIKWYRSQEYYNSGSWRGTRRYDGGGALMNQGIHQIDLLLWFMGNPAAVQARTHLVGHRGLEVEDLACAMVEFENGATGVIEGSTAIWPGHPARVEIHGTEGSAVLEDGTLRFWEFKTKRKADARIQAEARHVKVAGAGASDPMANVKCEGHRQQIRDFVKAINEDHPPKLDGREGARSVALIEAIYKSARAGGRVVRL